MFLPITATPFSHPGYKEVLPCKALAPYVRCFWTSWNEPGSSEASSPELEKIQSVVIPDLCVDIIIVTDGTENIKDGREITSMNFCGVNDKMFNSGHSHITHKKLFGIRLYSWQASLFSDDFKTAEKLLHQKLSPNMTLQDFKLASEDILLTLLNRPTQMIPIKNYLILDSIMQMIHSRGTQNLTSLLQDVHTSERQLERLFENAFSLSPKKVSSLIRYQSLWQEVCYSNHFDIQDAVFDYGYYDQSHLLNDFKKFHGMNLHEAKQLASSCRIFTIQNS